MLGFRFYALSVAAFALSACVSVRAPQLVPYGAAPTPAGFVDYCARDPEGCGIAPSGSQVAARATPQDQSDLSQRASKLFWRSAFAQARAARGELGPAIVTQTSDCEPSHTLATANAEFKRENLVSASCSHPMYEMTDVITDQQFHLLADINASVNRDIRPRENRRSGVAGDYWSTPFSENGNFYGDCKEYVIEKRRRLIAAGAPSGALSIAIADVDGDDHAVLIVSTERGKMVLDNLSSEVRQWERVPYTWLEIQRGDNPLQWQGVRVQLALGG